MYAEGPSLSCGVFFGLVAPPHRRRGVSEQEAVLGRFCITMSAPSAFTLSLWTAERPEAKHQRVVVAKFHKTWEAKQHICGPPHSVTETGRLSRREGSSTSVVVPGGEMGLLGTCSVQHHGDPWGECAGLGTRETPLGISRKACGVKGKEDFIGAGSKYVREKSDLSLVLQGPLWTKVSLQSGKSRVTCDLVVSPSVHAAGPGGGEKLKAFAAHAATDWDF